MLSSRNIQSLALQIFIWRNISSKLSRNEPTYEIQSLRHRSATSYRTTPPSFYEILCSIHTSRNENLQISTTIYTTLAMVSSRKKLDKAIDLCPADRGLRANIQYFSAVPPYRALFASLDAQLVLLLRSRSGIALLTTFGPEMKCLDVLGRIQNIDVGNPVNPIADDPHCSGRRACWYGMLQQACRISRIFRYSRTARHRA